LPRRVRHDGGGEVRLLGMLARVIQLLLAASSGTGAGGCAAEVGSVVVSPAHPASQNALSARALGRSESYRIESSRLGGGAIAAPPQGEAASLAFEPPPPEQSGMRRSMHPARTKDCELDVKELSCRRGGSNGTRRGTARG